MCGRFTLISPFQGVADAFDVKTPAPAAFPPRYNIAPSQTIAVVGLKGDGVTRGLTMLRWGLVPSTANDPSEGFKPTNARSDSLWKYTFREAFKEKRCIIPADGFYEWRTEGVGKKAKKFPVHFRVDDGALFGMAGLWEFWTDGTAKLATCCLITTEANAVVAPYHDRMPVILPPEQYDAWLDYETPETELRSLLVPYPADRMSARPANPVVNKASVEGPECLAAVA